MSYFLLVVVYLITTVGAIVLFKRGATGSSIVLGPEGISGTVQPLLFVGLGLYFLSFSLWLAVLSFRPISYIVPVTNGISQVLIIASGVILLRERLSLVHYIGISLIVVGTVLVTTRRL